MKKVILILCLAFGFSQVSNAQIGFGVKGGINYNSDSFVDVKNDVLSGAESRTGYHAGIWLLFKVPVVGLYIRPELVYTNLANSVTFDSATASAQTTDYNFQKIDIPVLLGKKIFGVGNIFIGPSFQYILAQDFSISDIPDVDGNGFTVGLQLGAGIEFGKLGVDIRWERGFNDVESSFLDGAAQVDFDTRVNQIIIGLSLKL